MKSPRALLHSLKIRLITRISRFRFKSFRQKTIVFESFGGRQISDSPLAIYNSIRSKYPDVQCYWSVGKELRDFCREQKIPFVVRESFMWVKALEKADVWVSNARFPAWLNKPAKVKFIQTWHGTPLKKLGLDISKVEMPGTSTSRYYENFVREANRWDILVSANRYSTNIFRKAFGYKNKILEIGYPRNDELVNYSDDYVKILKAKLHIPEGKKVVLYAPTFRDDQFYKVGKYRFELPFKLDDFNQQFGEDTILILRMHYLISNELNISKYKNVIFDFSNYNNISDLYLVSDVLITDYSSVFFDYAYLKKPIIFYPYDLKKYNEKLRGFYLDYQQDLPGEIAYNDSMLFHLLNDILSHLNSAPSEKLENFYNEFCYIHDGNAGEKIADLIMADIFSIKN